MKPRTLTRAEALAVRGRIIAGVVVSSSGCWEWSGARTRLGYGRVWIGRHILTHRAMWVADRGEIPPGLVVDHLCRNKSCCRPSHLDVVTLHENFRRGVSPSYERYRTGQCQRGHKDTPENRTRTGHCLECRRARQQSAPYRERVRAWKESHADYVRERAKEYQKHWRQTEEGKVKIRGYKQRYRETEAGRVKNRDYKRRRRARQRLTKEASP